jgi:predicted dehydrogenase
MQAGKDVYAEKPLSIYVSEGRALVKAVRKYNRILQVGSQQRSMAMNRIASDFGAMAAWAAFTWCWA